MNLLILNASPRTKGSASRFFSGLFRLFLPGVSKKTVPCRWLLLSMEFSLTP